MKSIIIQFQYQKEEYVKAVRKYLMASKTISKFNIVSIPIVFIYSIFNILLFDDSLLSFTLLILSLLLIFMGLLLYFYMPGRNFETISKYMEEYNLEFTGKEVIFVTESINSKLDMNLYKEIWESKDFYFLIQMKNVYTIIPKRVFCTKQHEKTFNDMILSMFEKIKKI